MGTFASAIRDCLVFSALIFGTPAAMGLTVRLISLLMRQIRRI